jgi:KUP system potassium uptake protein
VVIFHRSEALASAYGLAVTGMMVITTLMFMLVARVALRWPSIVVFPLGLIFLSVDLLFFSANILKVPDGGWIPLTIASIMIIIMTTWLRGAQTANRQFRNRSLSFTNRSLPHDRPGRGAFFGLQLLSESARAA